jgi:exonuclease SbcD
MRLVHLSDLHLGYRQFARQTAAGVNQREADVAATAERAIAQVMALAPELVLVGGDVFHSVRPPNSAILEAFRLFARLTSGLPDALVVMIAGNHDIPRASDAGCILQLFAELGVRVVHRGVERIDVPERDLSILAVPWMLPGNRREVGGFTPDPVRRHNVLLLHDEVRGVVPEVAQPGDRLLAPLDPVALGLGSWSYVGLGHYHVYRPIDVVEATTRQRIPAYYSGSLDYTSSNPWSDVREEVLRNGARPGEGKGFIEHDLATGAHRFHPVTPSRRLLDLPAIAAHGLTAPEVDARIAAVVADAGSAIDDAIVRLVVRDIPRHVLRTLDYTPLRELRRRAMHFALDARRPETTTGAASPGAASPGAASPGAASPGAAGRRITLRERLAERLRARPLAPGLDRDRLVELGLAYLARAEEQAVAALPVSEG